MQLEYKMCQDRPSEPWEADNLQRL
jgi:hypothetical protein